MADQCVWRGGGCYQRSTYCVMSSSDIALRIVVLPALSRPNTSTRASFSVFFSFRSKSSKPMVRTVKTAVTQIKTHARFNVSKIANIRVCFSSSGPEFNHWLSSFFVRGSDHESQPCPWLGDSRERACKGKGTGAVAKGLQRAQVVRDRPSPLSCTGEELAGFAVGVPPSGPHVIHAARLTGPCLWCAAPQAMQTASDHDQGGGTIHTGGRT